MKVALVFMLALCLCSPAFGQIDLYRVIKEFKTPPRCQDCGNALKELVRQYCTELEYTPPFTWITQWVDVRGACMFGLEKVGSAPAKLACEPFGRCKNGKQGPLLECSKCPKAIKNLVNSACDLLPHINGFSPKGICKGIVARLKLDTDFKYLCVEGGFCPA